MHSPLHCCNLSPKAGTSQLRYHSVPVGFGAGVRDAFSSAKFIETRNGADFRLLCFLINSIRGIAEKAKAMEKESCQKLSRKSRSMQGMKNLQSSTTYSDYNGIIRAKPACWGIGLEKYGLLDVVMTVFSLRRLETGFSEKYESVR